jgi:hypothetical protein
LSQLDCPEKSDIVAPDVTCFLGSYEMIEFGEFRKLHHAITLLGMSGVGKTHLSTELRHSANWFHYSADYRIGTRYLAEHIIDNVKFKIMQMEDRFVAQLLKSDSIYINHNISVDNLEPVSTFLGMYGDAGEGGLDKATFLERQNLYRLAEIESMKDAAHFITKAWNIYQCQNFINDASGSLCEIADPDDANDPVLTALGDETLILYIKADQAAELSLLERARTDPKPLFYNPNFILPELENKPDDGTDVSPLDFARPLFPELLKFRKPRYAAIAEKFGFTIDVHDLFHTDHGAVLDAEQVLKNVFETLTRQIVGDTAREQRFERYLNICAERQKSRS